MVEKSGKVLPPEPNFATKFLATTLPTLDCYNVAVTNKTILSTTVNR